MSRRLLSVLFALLFALPASSQEEYQATTAQDPTIETAVLELRVRPLRLAQVEAEVEAWIDVLEAKNREISALRIASRGTGEGAAQLNDRLAEQRRIVERVEVVLGAMAERGGEVEQYEKYVGASTGVPIDHTDAAGMLAMARDWLVRPDGGIQLGIDVLKFLLTLIGFWILARVVAGLVRRAVSRLQRTSELLRDFLVNATRKTVVLIGFVVALGMLGIEVSPFLAAIGAAGFVLAFALQGTLSNFAAGIMILIYRPFDVGQVVTVAGTTGKVDQMSLVSTTLRLFDNQTVIIPNNSIWGDVITNITSQTTRRVDMVFGCAYGDDANEARRVFEEILAEHPKVLADPAPAIKLHELADSSVNFLVRPWAKTEDYWDVYWDVTSRVKERFDAEGLNIPFPQRDVHVYQEKE